MNSKEPTIKDYVKVLRKRRLILAAAAAVVFSFILLATFLATPMYRATAQIYIDPGATADLTLQKSAQQFEGSTYLQTQLGVIKSESIAREVVARLGLDKTSHTGRPSPMVLAKFLGFLSAGKVEKSEADRVQNAVRTFMKRLEVESVKNSNLVKVSFVSEDPVLAAKVANTTVEAYMERNLEMKVAPARDAMNWLNGKLADIKGEMQESSERLHDFKKREGLVGTSDRAGNISLQTLTELNAKVLGAEANRYEAEVKYQQVQRLSKKPDGVMSHPDVISNRVIQDLKAQKVALDKTIAEMSEKYGERHPQMVRLKSEAETLDRQLKEELDLVVSSIKNKYLETVEAEENLKRVLQQQKLEALRYEKRSNEYELQRQDVEGVKELYDTLLKKFKESNLLGKIDMSNVQMLDRAVVPDRPSKPNKSLNVILGLFLSVFAGVGMAFLTEHLDNTFSSPEELESSVGLPVLGIVPKGAGDGQGHGVIESVVDPLSPMAESFRTIRGNLLLTRKGSDPKVIQVCSAMKGEGKSTVSVNLACAMASAGEKVLLIDGDMRRSRLHRLFMVPNDTGLSTLLTKKAQLSQVQKKTRVPNLSFIPSGPFFPNAGELLGSGEMLELITSARESFDRVIIDCPPYLGIADSSLLTPISDGAVLVVRSGKTIKDAVVKIKNSMETISAEILGVVLNDLKNSSLDSYYHYDYTEYVSAKKN